MLTTEDITGDNIVIDNVTISEKIDMKRSSDLQIINSAFVERAISLIGRFKYFSQDLLNLLGNQCGLDGQLGLFKKFFSVVLK